MARRNAPGRAATVARTLTIGLALAGCHRATASRCGADIPADHLWVETSDAEFESSLATARDCARRRNTRVLLEFVATWCADCQEMTRLDRTPEVSRVLRDRYEHVRVNVGHWDQHAAVLHRYGIDRIAAYVVLDANGERIAQTVLEPITGGHGQITAAQWIAWLEAPR